MRPQLRTLKLLVVGFVTLVVFVLAQDNFGDVFRIGTTIVQAAEASHFPFDPTPPAPPGIVIISVVVADNGDADGWADTNETVDLALSIYNRTGMDLTGVVATLSTSDLTVACISLDTVAVGSLAAGEFAWMPPFRFTVADLGRNSPFESFSAVFSVAMSSDQESVLFVDREVELDLDLDATGGSGPTVFTEGFESGLGKFIPMPLDQDLNPPDGDLLNNEAGLLNADGYRCQYSDPDWEGSFSYGRPDAEDCFPNPRNLPDMLYWTVTNDRAFSGTQALYWGLFLDESAGHTTPLAQLEAVRSHVINVGRGKVCSTTRTIACQADNECPAAEDCEEVTPNLSFKHQISLIDHRAGVGQDYPVGTGGATAIVQVQVKDPLNSVLNNWVKITPYSNVYDTQPSPGFFSCSFDPIDDGNDEGDFFDPTNPNRLLGPSSTCFPEFSYTDQGRTDGPFDIAAIGDASDGPGLQGSTGAGTWVETKFSLDRFRGRQIRLRFLQTGLKDNGISTWEGIFRFNPDPRDDGWFIDDVTVTDTLTEAATVTVDAKANTELKQDWDIDGVAATCDCAPDDDTAWDTPGEVTVLMLSHSDGAGGTTTLSWSPPVGLGGTVFQYDTLRSITANDFSSALCLETSDGPNTSATDMTSPASRAVHYFLVRAEHSCGEGPLGEDSVSEPRTGTRCL